MNKLACSVLSAAVVLAGGLALTAAQPRPEILIVGTYHMANPGRDIFNMSADDVLSPKRQAEIAQLLAVLKEFQPTKIAVESAVYEDKVKKQYADYLAGQYALTRNEIDQIGYRLAKELGMKAVFPVDYDGDFPMQRVVNYAKANGKSPQLDQMMTEIGDQDVGVYYREAHFGEPGD